MRPASDEEKEDARIEEAERREARWQQLRGHLYDPQCGCDDCDPRSTIWQMADRLGDYYGDRE